MDRRYRIAVIAILLSIGLALGCARDEVTGELTLETVVFPSEAYVGGTVAMALSSNYSPVGETVELYNVQATDLEIRIIYDEATGAYESTTPRGVYELRPAAASAAGLAHPGAFVSFAVFDLPTSLNPYVGGCPCPDIQILVVPLGITGTITILGPQDLANNRGHPTDLGGGFLGDQSIEEGLLSERMIRLRAVHQDKVADGFPDGQAIGAIEFKFWYSPTCMSNVRAYPNSEAANATTTVGPMIYFPPLVGNRIVMVDPKGFSLAHPYWSVAGQGPFVDLVFDWDDGNPACPETEFANILSTTAVTELFVTDLDGQPLVDRRGAGANDLVNEVLVARPNSS